MDPLSLVVAATCSWNAPGANPYQGVPAQAVRSYTDIPKPVQERLIDRMLMLAYDDVAEITMFGIAGKSEYTNLRDMHFGKKTLCRQPDMSKWHAEQKERGLVYCEGKYCVIVPTVCRNVSRVDKIEKPEPLFPEPLMYDEWFPQRPTSTPTVTGEPEQPRRWVPGPLNMRPGMPGGGVVPYTTNGRPDKPKPPPQTVPEPGVLGLLLTGLSALWFFRRRRG